jgi:hypothetical protein
VIIGTLWGGIQNIMADTPEIDDDCEGNSSVVLRGDACADWPRLTQRVEFLASENLTPSRLRSKTGSWVLVLIAAD